MTDTQQVIDYTNAVRGHAACYVLDSNGWLTIRDGSENGGRRDRMRVEMANSRAAGLRVSARALGRDLTADLITALS